MGILLILPVFFLLKKLLGKKNTLSDFFEIVQNLLTVSKNDWSIPYV